MLTAGAGLAVASVLAGCSGGDGDDGGDGEDGNTSPTATAAPLSTGRVQFVADQPQGYREFEPVPDATYGTGDVVWLYVEPKNVATKTTDGASIVDLTTTSTVENEAGETVYADERSIEQEIPPDEDIDELFLYFNFEPAGEVQPGTYTWTVEMSDTVANDSVELSREFTLEREVGIQAYKQGIEKNTDVTIDRLTREGDEIVLEYHSEHGRQDSKFGENIGFVAATFAVYVGNGWDVERLSVTTTTGDGGVYTWHVTRRTARAFYEERITTDEFVDRIFETFEEQ
ncbi:hypothetical protein ACKVMT_01165 [Halobacteriales archaeon Cl-PHB]